MKLTVTREEKGGTMKLTVEWEKPTLDKEKFGMVCLLIGIYIVGSGFFKFFSMMI